MKALADSQSATVTSSNFPRHVTICDELCRDAGSAQRIPHRGEEGRTNSQSQRHQRDCSLKITPSITINSARSGPIFTGLPAD